MLRPTELSSVRGATIIPSGDHASDEATEEIEKVTDRGTRLHLIDGGRPAAVSIESADDVLLCYPDGQVIPIGWTFDGFEPGGRHRRYVAEVPPSAHLAVGMTVRAGTVAVPVLFEPALDRWHVGPVRAGGNR